MAPAFLEQLKTLFFWNLSASIAEFGTFFHHGRILFIIHRTGRGYGGLDPGGRSQQYHVHYPFHDLVQARDGHGFNDAVDKE